ncbi:hypothetical protein NEOLEDRAFT_1151740 [Neolentinus lepideus HHB14362 ss-1]|uniref:Uncharacterized protein n=1 Tax=Neolentinus lepideus HHB14362 ss-1 TaxID=1314782 RepID=A0A165NLR6_9AGAM|nr:hypothetical protein NEOLEDRAFT_1151740 [Neolentinus lepideus HHB14362 ss-1]
MRLSFFPVLIAGLVAPVLGVQVTSTWTITYIQTCPDIIYTPEPTTQAAVTETLSLPYTTTSTFDVIVYNISGYPIFTYPTPPATPDPTATSTTTVVDYACTTTATDPADQYTIASPTTVYEGTTTTTEWAATTTMTLVTASFTYLP